MTFDCQNSTRRVYEAVLPHLNGPVVAWANAYDNSWLRSDALAVTHDLVDCDYLRRALPIRDIIDPALYTNDPNVTSNLGDGNRLLACGTVDTLVIDRIEHILNDDHMTEQAAGLLKPDGLLITVHRDLPVFDDPSLNAASADAIEHVMNAGNDIYRRTLLKAFLPHNLSAGSFDHIGACDYHDTVEFFGCYYDDLWDDEDYEEARCQYFDRMAAAWGDVKTLRNVRVQHRVAYWTPLPNHHCP